MSLRFGKDTKTVTASCVYDHNYVWHICETREICKSCMVRGGAPNLTCSLAAPPPFSSGSSG